MNETTKHYVFRIISIILVIMSFLMMFQPCIRVTDSDVRKKIKEVVRSLERELDKVENSDILYYVGIYDYSFDEDNKMFKKELKKTETVLKCLEDGAFSPKEIADVLSIVSSMANKIYHNDDLMELMDDEGRSSLLILILFSIGILTAYIIAIGYHLITVLLHILNKKFLGIGLILYNICVTIVAGCVAYCVNSELEQYLEGIVDDVRVFEIAPGAIWGCVFSVAALIFYCISRSIEIEGPVTGSGFSMANINISGLKDAFFLVLTATIKGDNKNNSEEYVMRPIENMGLYPQDTASGTNNMNEKSVKYCPKCGTKLKTSAVFCSGCGEKL